MAESKSTVILEQERADRFPSARRGLYLAWTPEQGDKLRTIQNEQSPPPAEDPNQEIIEDKFNSN